MNGKQGDAAMVFRRGGRSYNSLPRQLPSTVSVPYGFKIDLDFVRFCDNYYDNRDNQRSFNRLKNTKRSHKKSYNTLLGLRREKSDKQKSVIPAVPAPVHDFPCIRNRRDNKLASDLENSLGQVMSDFEETLERSRVNGGPAYLSDGASYQPVARRHHSLPRSAALLSGAADTLQHGSSDSSLSDSSAFQLGAPTAGLAREMAETIESLQRLSRLDDGTETRGGLRSVERDRTPGSGPAPTPAPASRPVDSLAHRPAEGPTEDPKDTRHRELSSIGCVSETTTFHQAQSNVGTQRMRELEEQVKAIPMLKHKLSVLREEKRSMEQFMRSRPRRDPAPEIPRDAAQRSVIFNMRSRSLSPAPDPAQQSRRILQDASTSCRVLTRDVGVYGALPSREPSPPQEPAAPRVLTRDVGVCGGPASAASPPRGSPASRSVAVLTELSDQVEPGRRRISLEAILSGRGSIRSVGTATRQQRLTATAARVEEVSPEPTETAPAPLGWLQAEESVPSVEHQRLRLRQSDDEERASKTRSPTTLSVGTSTEPRPSIRHAGATTELTMNDLHSADELRMQADELQLQLEDLRELHRASRASSETRDTFTQIKEYELGVNYVRGAFAFHKSSDQGIQTDTESAAVQVETAPRLPATRTFATQVRPTTASAGVQCRWHTESRGVEARPEQRDATVSAQQRLHTRSVACATEPTAVTAAASGYMGRRSPPRQTDVATSTVTPGLVSRAVNTDRSRELLKKVKTTMTDITPMRSVASGEHMISRHQSCQATPTVTDRSHLALSPSPGRESPLPPLARAGGSRIPRLATPPMTRKMSPMAAAAAGSATAPSSSRGLTRASSNLAQGPAKMPPVRRETSAPDLISPQLAAPAITAATATARNGSVAVPKATPAPKTTSVPPKTTTSRASSTPSKTTPVSTKTATSPSKTSTLSTRTSRLPTKPSTPPREIAADMARQSVSAEPKQRQFGRRDTFVARDSLTSLGDERGQGDTAGSKIAPLAGEEDFSSDDETKSTECMSVTKTASTPIQKTEPSAELLAALKVFSDSVTAGRGRVPSSAVTAATSLVQVEWFRVAGTRGADPHVVEDYLDVLEAISPQMLRVIVNMADNNSNTAMHYAVSHGNFDVVSVLLDSKVCDVQRQNNAGYTCIMLLSLAQIESETHRTVVRRLFHNGDVNVRAKQHGQTALMLAVSHGRLDMVSLLLEAGADINIQDEDGSTSLMCASEHGHATIVRMLLAHPECDTQLTDNDGCTALQVAMEAGHRDVGLLLYAHSNFSRGSSPYGSLRLKRGTSRTSTPSGRTSATPPRTPNSTPGLGRRSHSSLH